MSRRELNDGLDTRVSVLAERLEQRNTALLAAVNRREELIAALLLIMRGDEPKAAELAKGALRP